MMSPLASAADDARVIPSTESTAGSSMRTVPGRCGRCDRGLVAERTLLRPCAVRAIWHNESISNRTLHRCFIRSPLCPQLERTATGTAGGVSLWTVETALMVVRSTSAPRPNI